MTRGFRFAIPFFPLHRGCQPRVIDFDPAPIILFLPDAYMDKPTLLNGMSSSVGILSVLSSTASVSAGRPESANFSGSAARVLSS
jgi:hypothetical protein